MTNEKENLEIRKKSQQVSEKELKNVAGGQMYEVCRNNADIEKKNCKKCY